MQLESDLPIDNVSLTLVGSTATQGTFTPNNPGSNTWDVGTLPAGQTALLQIDATVNITSGTIITTASLTAVDQPEANPANNSGQATITVNRPAARREHLTLERIWLKRG